MSLPRTELFLAAAILCSVFSPALLVFQRGLYTFAKGRELLESELLKKIFCRRCRFSVHSFSEWPVLLSFLQLLLSQVLALLLWVPKSIWTQNVYHLSSHFYTAFFSTLSLCIPQLFSQPPVPALSTNLRVQALEWQICSDFWNHPRVTLPLKCSAGMCSVLLGLCHCKMSSPHVMWGFFIYCLGFSQTTKFGHHCDDFLWV